MRIWFSQAVCRIGGQSVGQGNLVATKIKKRPGLLRVAGRPNSPPPELLTDYITHRLRAWELHFRAMTWHRGGQSAEPFAHGRIRQERFVTA